MNLNDLLAEGCIDEALAKRLQARLDAEAIVPASAIEAAVRALHDDPIKVSLMLTGAATGLLKHMGASPGLSRTLWREHTPYDHLELEDELGVSEGGARCTVETSHRMAAKAYERAESLAQRKRLKNPADAFPCLGLGLTAAVATFPARKGADRIHVSTYGPRGLRYASFGLDKNLPRAFQSELSNLVALNMLLDGAGLPMLTLPLMHGVESKQCELNADGKTVRFVPQQASDGTGASDEAFMSHPLHAIDGATLDASALDPQKHILYWGSFNPLQFAHAKVARMMEELERKEVVFCITANHPKKGDLPVAELKRRRAQFLWRHPLLFTRNDGLFIEKARAFPGFSFLIGADVLLGILNPKYYGGSQEAVERTLAEFRSLGTTFYVVGRVHEGVYRDITNIDVPEGCHKLFRMVSGRWDVSSTQLR